MAALQVAALLCSGCGSSSGWETGLARALEDRDGPGAVRVYGGDKWAIPMEIGDMPVVVQRAVGFVLPDGQVQYSAEIWDQGERWYLVEKSYGGGDFRTVGVEPNGEVLVRSHSLPKEELPEPVRDRLATALGLKDAVKRLEFMHFEVFVGGDTYGRTGPWYRAKFGAAGVVRGYLSCDADGSGMVRKLVRGATVLVDVRVDPEGK